MAGAAGRGPGEQGEEGGPPLHCRRRRPPLQLSRARLSRYLRSLFPATARPARHGWWSRQAPAPRTAPPARPGGWWSPTGAGLTLWPPGPPGEEHLRSAGGAEGEVALGGGEGAEQGPGSGGGRPLSAASQGGGPGGGPGGAPGGTTAVGPRALGGRQLWLRPSALQGQAARMTLSTLTPCPWAALRCPLWQRLIRHASPPTSGPRKQHGVTSPGPRLSSGTGWSRSPRSR